MAECLRFYQTTIGSNSQSYDVYYSETYDIETCTTIANSKVILNPYEYESLVDSSAGEVLRVLTDPSMISTTDYEMLFMLGLTTPLFAYFVAWGFQTVISFMTKN